MSRETPLAHVHRLVGSGATGELICAGADLEVHVYLQRGRIAWATSSASPFAFGRELVRRCGVEPEALRELVEECRRTRRPLGETIVSWSLASHEDVRECLRSQIRDALETLVDRPSAPTLFLDRGGRYLEYDRDLTFAIDEVLARGAAANEGGAASCEKVFERVFDEVPELRWAEALRRGAVVASRPTGSAPRASTRQVAELAFAEGADVIAVRSGVGTMVGVARDGDTSIWLGLGREARLGSLFAALADLLPALPDGERESDGGFRASGVPCAACRPVLEDVLVRWADAEAASVLSAPVHGRPAEATTVHREGVAHDAIRELAASQARILAIDEVDEDTREPGDTEVRALASGSRSLLLGRGASWHLGAPVPDGSGRVLWLTVSRAASQGLAWALLGATARQLARVPCAVRGS